MRRAFIAGFDFIQQIFFEIPRILGIKKSDVRCAPMPESLPVYEKERVVEYRGVVDLTRKLSDS